MSMLYLLFILFLLKLTISRNFKFGKFCSDTKPIFINDK